MRAPRPSQQGLTLVELMISLVLGLVLIITLVTVILVGRQSYRTNEALAEVQESARTSFELLARDIRQVGVTGCGNGNRIANTLNPVAANWWGTWTELLGYDGADDAPDAPFGPGIEDRVAGTDAILVQSVVGNAFSIDNHNAVTGILTLNAANTDFRVDDILVVCDIDHATVFQASAVNGTGVEITHDAVGATPGNCTRGLGFQTVCDAGAGNPYRFLSNAQVARMSASVWYVGNNGRDEEGGRSLFRARLSPGGVVLTEEIVAGVADLQLAYREDGDDVLNADPVTVNWDEVNAVELTFTLDSLSRFVASDPAVNEGRLQRTYTTLIGLRNRLQ